MSLALVQSRALLGMDAPAVTVEVHLANGLPSFTLVGLADVEVKEARDDRKNISRRASSSEDKVKKVLD
jgi:magnesium chelatase family protein